MNFSSQQKQLVKPPQRGIFPLDHDAECKLKMQEYLGCLNQEKSTHYKCRELSRGYLQCRMDADLMAKEDLDELGFGENADVQGIPESHEGVKAAKGFVAGKHIEKPKKWFWQT